MTLQHNTFRIREHAIPRSVATIRHAVIDSLVERSDSREFRTALALCVTELVANAVVHAYDEPGGEVEVEGARNGVAVTIWVRDWGHGFDPEDAAAESAGAGLKVVRELTTALELDREDEGMTVTARVPLAVD